MTERYIYAFGEGRAEGAHVPCDVLGGKGASLHAMTALGLPVPSGFTISTAICTEYFAHGQTFPTALNAEVDAAMQLLETRMQRTFGDSTTPLLVSVRSGARASMPGMMDTILNLGLNDAVLAGWLAQTTQTTRDPAQRHATQSFIYDSYRRFIMMYADVVLDVPMPAFAAALEFALHHACVAHEKMFTTAAWEALLAAYHRIVHTHTGRAFPQDPHEQLWGAIGAVCRSWMSPRAVKYRELHQIPETPGTAVNVQAMVFGNMGDTSGTGVAFTRNPSTGEKNLFGEFLLNAQGEDVVAGIRTPQPLNAASTNAANRALPTLEQVLPQVYAELCVVSERLEREHRDMQDIEFTIERGTLYLLQCRDGKRTAHAAVRVAVEMAQEQLITPADAVLRVTPAQLDQLLHPMLDPHAPRTLLARGLPASPGAVSGQIVFDPRVAETLVQEQQRAVILVRHETSPDDIHGMHVARGILTARGGMTSHAAVVARGMGKCCVAGCNDARIDSAHHTLTLGTQTFREGDWLTLDGSSGEIFAGVVPTLAPAMTEHWHALMRLADAERVLRVRANADTPDDAATARLFGAEGIGLCRTEHMFFDPERITAVRAMILADSPEARAAALAEIAPMQQADFVQIFRAMDGLPVTIRLLDPPLHEFLPKTRAEMQELAAQLQLPAETIARRVEDLREQNPMLGHRGCRLGISHPEIYRMQARAIMAAACALVQHESRHVFPEIMIPLISDFRELQIIRAYVEEECAAVQAVHTVHVPYTIGTMIELPRAALTAGDIAHHADFFSFGTNDLTQTTFGISRDDGGNFLPQYINAGIYPTDPFASLDGAGVGQLIDLAIARGRATRADLKLGICGEHGGDPDSIAFCHQRRLDYVSCSPYRVPIARLAAAHAAIHERAQLARALDQSGFAAVTRSAAASAGTGVQTMTHVSQ